MAFCQYCGKELNDNAKFCGECGQAVANTQAVTSSPAMKEEQAEHIILEAKGSLLGGGTGRIVLTNKNISWLKSKANFVFAGALAFATKDDTIVNLNTISYIDTWPFLGGGGLQVHTHNGKNYKFGFNSKKDRDTAMSYINQKILGICK